MITLARRTVTRRLATAALAGGLAVASLTGCGIFGGNAIDCANITDEMNDTLNAIGQSDFDAKVKALRSEAKGIDDADLKKAVEDFADLAAGLDKSMKDKKSAATDPPDASKAQDMVDTIQDKCRDL